MLDSGKIGFWVVLLYFEPRADYNTKVALFQRISLWPQRLASQKADKVQPPSGYGPLQPQSHSHSNSVRNFNVSSCPCAQANRNLAFEGIQSYHFSDKQVSSSCIRSLGFTNSHIHVRLVTFPPSAGSSPCHESNWVSCHASNYDKVAVPWQQEWCHRHRHNASLVSYSPDDKFIYW